MSALSKSATTTGRTAEFEFEINAPVEDVWAAITEAEHLTNWFPLTAEVKPGQGGTMLLTWGDAFKGECNIEIWEPNHHLRTTFMDSPQDGPDAPDGPMRTFVDYHLESNEGSTTLRLVHSGFGKGADWDRLYDGVSRGWAAELRSLRHYLENHFGRRRRVAWRHHPFKRADAEVWALLMGERCLGLDTSAGLHAGDRFQAQGPILGEITGTVMLFESPCVLVGTIDELNDSYFRIELERCSGPDASVWFWVSAYGVPEERLREIDTRIEDVLVELVR